LVGGGYLTTNDVAAFDGMEVTFFSPHDDGGPQLILAVARPRTPDGQYICLLADGSVQQWSRSRYEDMRTNLGQEGAANGSQPIRSETNATSPVAGSHR
jgi:hypothetical protein